MNEEKNFKHNSLLANFAAMRQHGQLFSFLSCTRFIEARKLIMEGNRKYMDDPNGLPLKLKEEDEEGRMIQLHGVQARVYSAKLWEDIAAIIAVMTADNLDLDL